MFLGLIDNGAVGVVTIRNFCIYYIYVFDGFVSRNYIGFVVMDNPINFYGLVIVQFITSVSYIMSHLKIRRQSYRGQFTFVSQFLMTLAASLRRCAWSP